MGTSRVSTGIAPFIESDMRRMHRSWNLVRDTDPSSGERIVRPLHSEEEEILMGFPAGYTSLVDQGCSVGGGTSYDSAS